jgi:hypothetical protein
VVVAAEAIARTGRETLREAANPKSDVLATG